MSDERNILEQVEDTTNRLDVLLYRVAERFVEQSPNPMSRAGWNRFKNPLAEFLSDNLGPIAPREEQKDQPVRRKQAPVRRKRARARRRVRR